MPTEGSMRLIPIQRQDKYLLQCNTGGKKRLIIKRKKREFGGLILIFHHANQCIHFNIEQRLISHSWMRMFR